MGSPPPPDAPPPGEQDQQVVDATFEPSPTGGSLCGFGFPSFSLSVNIPGFQFPPALPQLNLSLALVCDLDDPLDADLSFGGGRVAQPLNDPDEVDE